MSIVIENEKTFHYYIDFPSEVQRMVIDEMQPDDRCRFTRCSNKCNRQAKGSKKYIYAVEMEQLLSKKITISVVFNSNFDNVNMYRFPYQRNRYGIGFFMNFEKVSEKNYMRYQGIRSGDKWIMELDSSADLELLAVQYFKTLLQSSYRSVQRLSIDVNFMKNENELKDFDFEVESFPNLKTLKVYNSMDTSQFLSKVKHPLKEFSSWEEIESNHQLANSEQIYQVYNTVDIPNLKLNNEQFLQLSASEIVIHIGELTAQDIINFIKLWQNGEAGNKLISCSWNFEEFDSEVPQLFKLFGVEYNDDDNEEFFTIPIKHQSDPSKSAVLDCYVPDGFFSFKINTDFE